ncbi:gp062-like protein [Phenacoccus solenopsis nudivirus]|nr:gp062-like protein [Phenacoccus solenopsis nudivirus]
MHLKPSRPRLFRSKKSTLYRINADTASATDAVTTIASREIVKRRNFDRVGYGTTSLEKKLKRNIDSVYNNQYSTDEEIDEGRIESSSSDGVTSSGSVNFYDLEKNEEYRRLFHALDVRMYKNLEELCLLNVIRSVDSSGILQIDRTTLHSLGYTLFYESNAIYFEALNNQSTLTNAIPYVGDVIPTKTLQSYSLMKLKNDFISKHSS